MPRHPSDKKVLFVLSNKGSANLSAVAAAYFAFTESIPDVHVVVASPAGGNCPVAEVDAADARAKAFATDDWEGETRLQLVQKSSKLADVDPSKFDAVMFFGDSASGEEFLSSPLARDTVTAFQKLGKAVGAIGGGLAALVGAKDGSTQEPLLKDTEVAAQPAMKALVEKLREEGAHVKLGKHSGDDKGDNDNALPDISISEKLVTGPNPLSAQLVAQGLIEASKDDEALERVASF